VYYDRNDFLFKLTVTIRHNHLKDFKV